MKKIVFISVFLLFAFTLFSYRNGIAASKHNASNSEPFYRTWVITEMHSFTKRDILMTIHIPFRYSVKRMADGKFKFSYLPMQNRPDSTMRWIVSLAGSGMGEINYKNLNSIVDIDPAGNLSFDIWGLEEKRPFVETTTSTKTSKKYIIGTATTEEIVQQQLNHITGYRVHGEGKLETIGATDVPSCKLTWTGYSVY